MAIPTSIVDYLKSTGQPSDFASRSSLAASKGIQNYTGTAQQNIQLLGMLRTPTPAAPVAPIIPKAPEIPTPQPVPQPIPAQPVSVPNPIVPQPAPQPSIPQPVPPPSPVAPQPIPAAPTPIPPPIAPTQPAAPSPVVAPAPTPTQTYVVKPGDTLSAIAGRLGVPISSITGYRSGNPNRIFTGETLTVSQPKAPTAAPVQVGSGQPIPSIEVLSPRETERKAREASIISKATAFGLPKTTTFKEASDFLQGMGVSVDSGKAITNPTGSWQDTYQDLFKNLGLDKVRENINSIGSKIEALGKEKAEKAAVINDNPWISEAQRSREIGRLDSEYSSKEQSLTSALSLYQDTYKQGREEAQFIVTHALSQYNAEKKFSLEERKLLADQAEAKAKAIADLNKINPAVYKEVQGGLFNVETGKWIIQPKAKAEIDVSGTLSSTSKAIINNPSLFDDLTPTQRGKIINELQVNGYDTAGLGVKGLSDTAIKEISQSQKALSDLSDLRSIIENNKDKIGPIVGLEVLNPYSEKRRIQADIDRVKQTVGKALEGGVLRREDEEKYKKILATITDTPETALYKLDSIISSIQRDVENYKSLQRSGGRSLDVTKSLSKSKSSKVDFRSKYNY